MPKRDIAVVGASAGGLAPLRALAEGLPADYAGSLFVVLHLSPEEPTSLGEILTRAGPIPASEVKDADPILPGHVYVAGPNRHLVVEPGIVRSMMGPKENRFRPSIDVLFRSAAIAYGERTVGVVLSGMLDDGAAGLAVVKLTGGVTVVQDPEEAEQSSMPLAAMRAVPVDHRLPASRIGPLLADLARRDVELPAGGAATTETRSTAGSSFALSCPSCNGTLVFSREAGVGRYRCRVGHAFSEDSLAAEHDENVERALWTALRVLEERVVLQHRLAQTARERGLDALAAMHDTKAEQAEKDVVLLRDLVKTGVDETSNG